MLWCFGVPVVPASAIGPGLVWPDRPVSSAQAAGTACADVLFVGVRGSVEAPPYGGTVRSWRDALAARTASLDPDALGAGRVREFDLNYPATAPETILSAGLPRLLFDAELPGSAFTDSVAAGVSELRGVLDDARTRCPQERWVLVGYSQGAQVINQALAADGDHDQLVAAVLLGNPGHFAGQQVTEVSGSAPETANGLMSALYYIRGSAAAGRDTGGQAQAQADGVKAMLELGQSRVVEQTMIDSATAGGLALPASDREDVQSICAEDDLVCDAGAGLYRVLLSGRIEPEIQRAAGPHGSYGADQHPEAVDRVVERLELITPGTPAVPSAPVATALGGIGISLSVIIGVTVWLVLVGRQIRRRAAAPVGRTTE